MTGPTPDRIQRDLRNVLEITRSLMASTDLDQLLPAIVDRSLELLEVERGTVFLYEPDTNELVSRVATGIAELRVPADKGICGQTVQTGQTILVPDAYADERFNPAVDRETGFRTRNIMSVPLRGLEGDLVGVLQVLNKTGGDFSEYDVELAETLAAQVGVVLQRASLVEHYIQKQEMERAMAIARQIQQDLLPGDSPDVPGFEVAGLSDPADETGGDVYDFMPLGRDTWGVCVADATGHGIGAALMIAETRAMLRASTEIAGGLDLPAALGTANRILHHDIGLHGRFVTCFLGALDAGRRRLRYASAGHGPLLFYRWADDTFDEVAATGLPLGVLDDAEFDEVATFDFAPGDLAVITTDGVFEAMDADGNQFGIQRVKELLRAGRDLPAETLATSLHDAVGAWSAGRRDDDITAVIIACR